MKTRTISQRIKTGWTTRENKQKALCDVCGSRLWIAPHGKTYCDNIHEFLNGIEKTA